MTYQEELLNNKYAQIALDVGHKYKLQQPALSELWEYLFNKDDGKHEQHLRMLAVEWCKQRRT